MCVHFNQVRLSNLILADHKGMVVEGRHALNRAGFEVVLPEAFVANADLYMAGERRVVVALTGSELSRGRGGPRCLTLPLARAMT